MSSPPLQRGHGDDDGDGDGDESYKGESCTSFEFIERQRVQKPSSLIRASYTTSAHANKMILKQSQSQSQPSADHVIDLNKINYKKSPSLNEFDEMKETSFDGNEYHFKKDGFSQTDKKDMANAKHHYQQQQQQQLHNNHMIMDSDGGPGPFEREIQKLLDEQNLLKNNPPKSELKDILSLDEIANVNQQDSLMSRYGCRGSAVCNNNSNLNNNNDSSPLVSVSVPVLPVLPLLPLLPPSPPPPLMHQVGLAAIQVLARKQQDDLNNCVAVAVADRDTLEFKFIEHALQVPLPMSLSLPDSRAHDRDGSKDSSLKRNRSATTPDSPDANKLQKITSLPRNFPVQHTNIRYEDVCMPSKCYNAMPYHATNVTLRFYVLVKNKTKCTLLIKARFHLNISSLIII